MSRPEIVLIAAVGEANRVIGRGMDLPWHLSEDLKRFKRLTLGHPLLMGRRTYESLILQFGKPLPNRRNLVVSGSSHFEGDDQAEAFDSVEAALAAAADAPRIFIGGGASIYSHFLEKADRMELTLVEGEHDGDVFFPAFEHLVGTQYRITCMAPQPGFRFVTYRRISPDPPSQR